MLSEPMTSKGTLYLVGTPIGNLTEFSSRGCEVLSGVDVIYAEDTRVSKKLLFKFSVKTQLLPLYDNCYKIKTTEILDRLKIGEKVAVITDAGMPCISDPGYELVTVVKNDYPVIPISGPSALISCLVASGLPANPFLFLGFLPRSNRDQILKKYILFEGTIILYESPHRVLSVLQNLLQVYGDLDCCVGREITKIYESFYYGTISKVINKIGDNPQGEFVICVYKKASDLKLDLTLTQQIEYYLNNGYTLKDAQKKVASDNKTSKKAIYEQVLKEKNK